LKFESGVGRQAKGEEFSREGAKKKEERGFRFPQWIRLIQVSYETAFFGFFLRKLGVLLFKSLIIDI
jgi:hypothetical protein